MACHISLNNQGFWVSNSRMNSLLSFALQIANENEPTLEQQGWIEKVNEFYDLSYLDFDMSEQFSCLEEMKYWAEIFRNVARRIFLREIGNHENLFWQSSAIGDANLIARILTHAVQLEERGWSPRCEDSEEAAAFNRGSNLSM